MKWPLLKPQKNAKTKILFITATHGNEAFSLPVLQGLEKEFPHTKFNYDWIIGNPKALEQGTRFIETDLNRTAPGNLTSTVWEEKRAAQLIELSKHYDIVIDIHGTKSDFGIVKIIPYPTYENLVLAGYFPEKRNVIWYSKKKKGPLAQFMHCPALELECGDKTKKETQVLLHQELGAFLQNVHDGIPFRTLQEQSLYKVFGKETHDIIQRKDFKKIQLGNETFYPFLTENGYKDISYYKMQKVTIEELFYD